MPLKRSQVPHGPALEHYRDLEVRSDILFIDSGAHSLYSREVINKAHASGYKYYDSPEFWTYVDEYCNWIKKRINSIDYYANVDVIFDPERSWKVLKYMENEHGLKPIPVIHFGTDLKWFDKHLNAGYEYLGIGGLGQEATRDIYMKWADKVFDFLCPRPTRLPLIRTHGFAMTSFRLMTRYPFWSVDSASWSKAGGYGKIYVPHKRGGKFTFDVDPYMIAISTSSPTIKKKGTHVANLSKQEAIIVKEWLEFIKIPLGEVDENNEMVTWGAFSHHEARAIANLRFFEAFIDWMPEWPWRFSINVKKGLELQ